ncbi:MAG: SMC-Scp complex subunit ScpB [Oscillospiraceae bacterium]|nr:SMC-Scp complex subunit ScpB [Oscillospiraceae bacterium]
MDIKRFRQIIEAILFASGEPIPAERIADTLESDKATVIGIINHLNDIYEERSSGLYIANLGGAYQMCTRPELGEPVKKALDYRRNMPLSQAAMEILAIIAYNQPVTKSFCEQVRGVDCSGVISSLCEKGLIEEAGRLELPGRPIAYRTTAVFLRCFGFTSLTELPALPGDDPSPDALGAAPEEVLLSEILGDPDPDFMEQEPQLGLSPAEE